MIQCLSVGRGPGMQGLPEFREEGFMRARAIIKIIIKVTEVQLGFVKWEREKGKH